MVYQRLGRNHESRKERIYTTDDFTEANQIIEEVNRRMSEDEPKTEWPLNTSRVFKKSLHLYNATKIPIITKSSALKKEDDRRKNYKEGKVKSAYLVAKSKTSTTKGKLNYH